MTTLYIVALEKLEQRYTAQWYEDIPQILMDDIKKKGLKWKVRTIAGKAIEDTTTDGAFLDFAATNAYKASQVISITKLFQKGQIKPGDKFLITDFWNFVIPAIKYMSELLEIPVEIHSIAHSGAYDSTDILGMKMSKPWPYEFEKSCFLASNFLYFGTEFHRTMFLTNLRIPFVYHDQAIRSGQPSIKFAQQCFKHFNHEWYGLESRSDRIVFPHRLNEDKQPEIFRDLAESTRWDTFVTQDAKLSKELYYDLLAQSKVVFSCSLHENLGISQMEGVLCGCIPIVPDRASYSEIYLDVFKYPSEWTASWDNYLENKQNIINFINDLLGRYDQLHDNELRQQAEIILRDYMSPTIMVDNIVK